MAALGFALLLFNALGYILHWQMRSPIASILGIVLLGAGLAFIRKSRGA
jgi:hypothetical protein